MRSLLVRGLFATLAVAFFAGCNTVESVHPLSDDKTTVVDERLVGIWMAVDKEEDIAKASVYRPTGDEREKLLTIRTTEGRLEGVGSGDDDKIALLATKIGERSYLSLKGAKSETYGFFGYDFGKEKELRLYWMNPEKTIAAVKAKKLAGEIKRSDPNAEGRTEERVKLTASTKELREFLATPEGEELFHRKEPMIFVRMPTP